MQYVLGIDIGTGSVKAVAVDLQGKSLEVSQQHYSFSVPKPGYHEQNPEEIWAAFIKSIKEIVIKTAFAPLTIGLSSAMHSLIAVDKTGRALAPMSTWADNRSAEIARKLKDTAEGIAIYKNTGTPIHPMSPLCKLIWMRDNDTQVFNSAYKFISIKEYIWHKLFNEFKIDHSIASGTGLFDITKLKWHDDSMSLAGITAASLSEPVPTRYSRTYSSIDFLPAATPFVIAASDGCMANLGSMAKPGVAVMTVGTSGAVRVSSNKPLPNERAMTFSYILDEETFVCGGPINNGGIALQWWLKNVDPQNGHDYEGLFEQVNAIPAGSDGLFFLPYITGERAPVWDSESCGTFFGIKLNHTQAHFSKAVLEGVCYAMKDVLDAVQQNSVPITQINVGGGFVQSDEWVQIMADVTGINQAVMQTEDASAMGAALMAMKSAGLITEYPSSVFGDHQIFRPNPANVAVYANSFGIYKQLYPALKESMHLAYRLNS